MSTPPNLTLAQLRDFISDGEELKKGALLFDQQALQHLSRHENRLFAEAKGSGSAPYKVQAVFDDGKVKGRCSCMAARSRPFCKHATALLVAWTRAPEGFAVADVAPVVAAEPGAKKRSVKTGKVDAQDLMATGVAQVATLVRELALSGVASLGRERTGQIAALATSLREHRLRRLSARTLELSEAVELAGSASDRFDATGYADLFADMLLTARKLEKHLAGEALAPVHVEELIGKTWTKKDRTPVEALQLVEYSFQARVTADGFVLRESRFVDLGSGQHYSEKQILPAFLAKRTEPKKSHFGWLLDSAQGSQYPSFAPFRLDVEATGERKLLSSGMLDRLVEKALPSISEALVAFQERRKDVFAPDTLPVAVKVDTVLAEGARLQIVDANDGALFLPDDALLHEQLDVALRGARLEVLLGDVALDGALPTLFPLAAVVSVDGARSLKGLGALDAASVISSRKVQVAAAKAELEHRRSWADTARALGISSAAITLGEVRDELAQALVSGLHGLAPRLTDALCARLRELGLVKPADLLDATAKRADAAEKLDDFVKVYQVLGIGLTRLTGATHVDRSLLAPVPTMESVKVRLDEERLTPVEISERVADGSLNRYSAAVRYAAYYDAVPPEELARNLYPTWADGSAQPYVVRVFATRPEQALEAAANALGLSEAKAGRRARSWSRMVHFTALNVLEAVGTVEAAALLKRYRDPRGQPLAQPYAERCLRNVLARRAGRANGWREEDQSALTSLTDQLLNASHKDERASAAAQLAARALVEAIPSLRASARGDIAGDVREASCRALSQLGDTGAVPMFVQMLRGREASSEEGKLGAHGLSDLGDVRGLGALLDAWESGWQPGVMSEAFRHFGISALPPLLERIEAKPELLKKKASTNFIVTLPAQEVAETLLERLSSLEPTAFVERATQYATLAAALPPAGRQFAQGVLAQRPGLGAKTASKEEKALQRRLNALLPEVRQG